ncbi:MAG: DUF935 domain-containing protein [Pseudomonadota bacterium]
MGLRDIIKVLWGGDGRALDEAQSEATAWSAQLKREFAQHPSKGLTPAKLYQILEDAEQGDLKAQGELFDDMEEKDAQIGADLAKRRQLAAELEWQIVPPDNPTPVEKRAAEQAAAVFAGLDVEVLVLEMGAAIGHGWANLELPWARDGAERYIEQPILRPHGWFRLHPHDQDCITLRDFSATGAALWPLGWVQHRHKAKPGYIARAGLGRMLAWPYLFQNYALGDLAQLLEIYGMPARVGSYPRNASDQEKATLLRAVVNLGSNAAGIIPEGMRIDYLAAADGRADVFEAMINWCERAKAKAILGGTLTSGTGEGTNTNALGNVHERAQQSLIRSDARQYAGTIGRDILWPMAALNFGIADRRRAPRFYLETVETEDFGTLSQSLPVFVDLGMRIPKWWVHERSGIPVAGDTDEVLERPPAASPLFATGALRRGLGALKALPAPDQDAIAAQTERLAREADAALEPWVEAIRGLVDKADSLEDLRDRLVELLPDLPAARFAQVMGDALAAAHLAGRYDLTEGL